MIETIIKEHGRAIEDIAARYFVGSKEDREDAVQELYLKLLSRTDQYEAAENKGGWVWTVAMNLFTDIYRRNRKSVVDAVANLPEVADEGDPLAVMMKYETLDNLYDNYSSLSPRYREVLDLHYSQGLSYEEIAAKLNLSLGGAASRLNRAKKVLTKEG